MALGSVAKPDNVSSGASNVNTLTFDNSGFVVSVGRGATASSSKTSLPTPGQAVSQALGQAAAVSGGLLGNPLFIVAVGVGLFLYLKHK